MRAVSTVMDVAVFVLLVAAAVGTLVVVDPPAGTDTSADETAEVVASSTLSVEYELRGSTRRAHGTMGSLLARGAVADATLRGSAISETSDDYRETVRSATRQKLAAPERTQLEVRWEPYPDAPIQGSLAVGSTPPDGIDVHTATVTVPAPVPDSGVADGSRPSSYDPVAYAVAQAVAGGLLPSNRVDASVYRESPTAVATSARYRAIAGETDVSVDELLIRGNVGAAHSRIVDGLARLFAEDMQRQFDSPEDAAIAVRTGEVDIIVRRWDE